MLLLLFHSHLVGLFLEFRARRETFYVQYTDGRHAQQRFAMRKQGTVWWLKYGCLMDNSIKKEINRFTDRWIDDSTILADRIMKISNNTPLKLLNYSCDHRSSAFDPMIILYFHFHRQNSNISEWTYQMASHREPAEQQEGKIKFP